MGCLIKVGLKDVFAAERRIRGVLKKTPLVFNQRLDAWLKLECLQTTGAYKVRGALNALILQMERNDYRTVVAASAGNHGLGVAWAAKYLGLKAMIVVPKDSPRTKIEKIHKLGAKVIVNGSNFDESLGWAKNLATRKHARFLHAFDDPDIIAGQGTIALEVLKLAPSLVLAPIGGGGLAAGVSVVLKEAGIPTIGVQIDGVDAMNSFLGGGPTKIEPNKTIADGLRVSEAGQLTREICRSMLTDTILVTEEEVKHTIVSAYLDDGIIVEGAGAVSMTALKKVSGSKRLALVTGGNLDTHALDSLINDYRHQGAELSNYVA